MVTESVSVVSRRPPEPDEPVFSATPVTTQFTPAAAFTARNIALQKP